MATATTDRAARGARWVLPLTGGLLLAIAGEGPDFGHYADWAWAALQADIFNLRGNVLSPAGVPFTIASSGTGLLLAAGKSLMVPMPFSTAAIVTGWLAAVTFWASALVVLRHVARGQDALVWCGAGVLFLGTHAGLYSHAYSTEVFANALIAVLWAFALTRQRWALLECAAMGTVAGLLFLVRPHVVLYAAPALWVAFRGVHAGGSDGAPLQSVWTGLLWRGLAIAVPLGIAVAQYGMVNRWMTGVPWHPPYVYGGEGFSSVDMAAPELAAVLVHPWHGLLSYHPVYGLAFVGLVVHSWRTRRQLWWSATTVAVLVHVWVQAAWYIWWLGGSTFGMRGMAPAALPLIAGLIATIRRDADTDAARTATWLWGCLVAGAWSYPLLVRGNTQFLSWRELLDAQAPATIGLVVIVCGWAAWRRQHRIVTIAQVWRLAGAMSLLLAAATAAYLAWQFALQPASVSRAVRGALGAMMIALVFQRLATVRSRSAAVRSTRAGALAAIALFALQSALFARLAIRTEAHRASGAAPPRTFEYVGASPVDELRMTYSEYLRVPGFEDRKAAFRRFLAWQRVQMSPMSPADRQLADAFRRRASTDPVLREALVEATASDGVLRIPAAGITDGLESRAREVALAVPGVRSVTLQP